jgi:hypothetical protein
VKGSFVTLDDIKLPDSIKSRFTGIGESKFRKDISSSSIRSEEV